MAEAAGLQQGLVVGSQGRHCMVESVDGSRRICHPRGKKSQTVVGDRVLWLAGAVGQGDEGTVEKVLPRRNLFYRQDEIRTKSFAANLDRILVLVAAEPEFSAIQLTRALVAAAAEQIVPIIALNKRDLAVPFAKAWDRLLPYRRMGYTVLPLALKGPAADDRSALLQELHGKTTLVLGPSGAGKSTLTNLLVPGALASTREISQALNSGKHTTTSTTWYWVEDPAQPGVRNTALIDSPGFQEFGLHHIAPARLAACMPDIAAHADECRFYNCTHLHEPGCGVRAAVVPDDLPFEDAAKDAISAHRYKLYGELFAELSQPLRY